MTRTQTFEHLFDTIGIDGLDALVAEGLRRRLNIREIARHLNIPLDNAEYFAVGHENEFPLQPGERIRLLSSSNYWHGYGTVIEQKQDRVTFWKDGTPKPDAGGCTPGSIGEAMRHEIELTTMPELLPAGTTYNGDGYLVVPCVLSKSGKQLEFYCPHCKQMHRHGNGDGHRVSHCIKQDSPLRRGYYIVAKH